MTIQANIKFVSDRDTEGVMPAAEDPNCNAFCQKIT